MKAQPQSCAKRRISKMRKGLAAAGWTCRVAVVCICVASLCGGRVRPNINYRLIFVGNYWLIFSSGRLGQFDGGRLVARDFSYL